MKIIGIKINKIKNFELTKLIKLQNFRKRLGLRFDKNQKLRNL